VTKFDEFIEILFYNLTCSCLHYV